MAVDFEKEYQKKKKIKRIKNKIFISWNNYRFPFFLFPLAFCCWIKDNIYTKYYRSLRWDEARADRVLNKVIPKIADKDEKTNSFYYCLDWNNRQIFLKYCNFIDKTWIKANFLSLLYYLTEIYCVEGYVKIRGDDDSQIFFIKTLDSPTEK